jgi:hypothetical protein
MHPMNLVTLEVLRDKMEDNKMARIAKINFGYIITLTKEQLDVMCDALSRYEGKR